jgi:hypothetical protein
LIFGALWFLWVVSVLVTYVLTGIWLGRARRNAALIVPDRQGRSSKAWGWLGWIVPIASFVFPIRVSDDVWRATVRDHEKMIKWWGASWIAWLVLGLFDNAVEGGITNATIAGYATGLWILAVATTIALPFWIPVVRTLSQAQDALASRAAASGDVRW